MYLKISLYFAFFIGSSYLNELNDLGSLAKVFAALTGGGTAAEQCNFVCPGGKSKHI